MERTLVLLKPDAVDRGLVGEIMHRFERVGLKIVGLKMVQAERDHAERHYTEDLAIRRGQHVRDMMISMLMEGPVVALCLEGIDSVELVRKMVGGTEPKAAAPGTIRGDYSHMSFKHSDEKKIGIYNLIHASENKEAAEKETGLMFAPSEIFSWKKTGHEHIYLPDES
jgi:nucleoside-diphosphate kinase